MNQTVLIEKRNKNGISQKNNQILIQQFLPEFLPVTIKKCHDNSSYKLPELKSYEQSDRAIHLQNKSFFETKVSNFYVHSFF
jgi:hypothetical protein